MRRKSSPTSRRMRSLPEDPSANSTTSFLGRLAIVTSSSSATLMNKRKYATRSPPTLKLLPSVSAANTDVGDAPDGVQDDNSDGGDEAGSP
jgi:hypothetical protein